MITGVSLLRWGTESAQRLLELQSGTVDAIDNVGPDDFETVQGDSNLQLLVRPALNVMYIGFNNNPKADGFDNSTNPLAKEEVRQAIAMGIDRQRIVDQFYPPGSEVASHRAPSRTVVSVKNGTSSMSKPPRQSWRKLATRMASKLF
jgi:ABC-type transport system substrate-binding protein